MLLALVILCMMPVSAFAAGGTTAVLDGKVIPSCTVQYYLKLSDGTQVPIADPVSAVVNNHDTVKDFDVLYGSHDFTLAGVNVMKHGGDYDAYAASDWTSYTDVADKEFVLLGSQAESDTSKAEGEASKQIVVDNGDYIRFLYTSTNTVWTTVWAGAVTGGTIPDGVKNESIRKQQQAVTSGKQALNFEPVTVEFGGEVELDGRNFAAGDALSFTMTPRGGDSDNPVSSPVTSKALDLVPDSNFAHFSFDSVTYSKPGHWTYIVSPVSAGLPDGVTADSSTYELDVTVSDTGNGTLSAQVLITKSGESQPVTNGDGMHFVYTYSAASTPVNVSIPVRVTLDERDIKDTDNFTVNLTRSNEGNPMPDGAAGNQASVEVNGDGTGVFNLTFTDVGSYEYSLSMGAVDNPNIQASAETCSITIDVTKNGTDLVSNVTTGGAAFTEALFECRLAPSALDVSFNIEKSLVGRSWNSNDSFDFEVSLESSVGSVSGTWPQTVSISEATDGRGTAQVPIRFQKSSGDGEYVFRVREKVPDNLTGDALANMQFDSHVWLVKYKIGYDESDNLTVVSAVKESSSSARNASLHVSDGASALSGVIADEPVPMAGTPASSDELTVSFVNTYTVQPLVFTIDGTATIQGRNFQTGDELEYTLTETTTGSDCLTEPYVSTFTPDKGSVMTMGVTQSYSTVRQHTYTLKNTDVSGDGLACDTTEYTITVDVTQNESGALSANASVVKNGEACDMSAIVFNYNVSGSSPEPSPNPPAEGEEFLDGVTGLIQCRNHKLSGDDMITLRMTALDGPMLYGLVKNGEALEYQYVDTYDIRLDMSDGFFNYAGQESCNFNLPLISIKGPGMYGFKLEQIDQGGAFTEQNKVSGYYSMIYDVSESTNGNSLYDITLYLTYHSDENPDGVGSSSLMFSYEFEASPVVDVLTFTGFAGVRIAGRDWTDDDSFTVEIEPVTPEGDGYVIVGDMVGSREVAVTKGYYDKHAQYQDNKLTSGDGTVVGYANPFGVRFYKDGTYTFRLKQVDYSTTPRDDGNIYGRGFRYDNRYWDVTCTVDMSAGTRGVQFSAVRSDGQTFAEIMGSTTQCILLWDNVYVENSDSVRLEGRMTLSGREFTENDGIVVHCIPRDNAPSFEHPSIYVAAASGNEISFDFGSATFPRAGVYEYEIKVDSDTNIDGVTVDDSVFVYVVTVTENEDGTFSSSTELKKNGETVTELLFEHEVPTDSVQVPMGLSVSINGRDWNDTDSFEFKISPKNNEAVSGVQNGTIEIPETSKTVTSANGPSYEASFGKVVFSEEGTYTFDISCTTGMPGGMTIVKNTIPVEVTVVNNSGVWSAEYKVDGTTADSIKPEFELNYSMSGVTTDVNGKIELAGRPFEEGDSFTVHISSTDFGEFDVSLNEFSSNTVNPIPFTLTLPEISAPGEYLFTLTMKEGDLECVTYNTTAYVVRVTVSDNGDGTLSSDCEIVSGNDVHFVNRYVETMPDNVVTGVRLSAEVELTGRDWKETDLFNIRLEAYDDVTRQAIENNMIEMPSDSGTTVTVSESNKEAFWNNILFHDVGTYKFKATQEAGSDGGMVYDSEPYIITVVTEYSRKTRLTATVSGQREGTTRQSMMPLVDINSDGDYDTGVTGSYKCLFSNSYHPQPASVPVSASVRMAGRNFEEGDSFTLHLNCSELNVSEEKIVEPVGGGMHNVSFEPLVFTDEGVYYYTVSQDSGDLPNVTYDNKVFRVKVTVTDGTMGKLWAKTEIQNGESEVSFRNVYEEPAPEEKRVGVTLDVSKSIRGRDWADIDEFAFEVTAADKLTERAIEDGDVVMPANTTVMVAKGNETASFNPIVFKDTGLYAFRLSERAGDAGGMTYDANQYNITVTVSSEGGELVASVASDRTIENVRIDALSNVINVLSGSDAFSFENFYEAEPVIVSFDGSLRAADGFSNGSYTVALSPSDKTSDAPVFENTSLTVDTIEDDTSASFDFGELTYDEPGTYYYTLTVTNNKTNESASFEMAVNITDNNEGNLNASVSVVTSDGIQMQGMMLDIASIVDKEEPPVEPTVSPKPSTEPSVSPEPTDEPSSSPEPTDEPSSSPEPTDEPSSSPAPTTEPDPTSSPKPTPKPTPVPSTEPSSSPEPSVEPSESPKPDVEPYEFLFNGEMVSGDKMFHKGDSIELSLMSEDGSPMPDESELVIKVEKDSNKLYFDFGSALFEEHGEYAYVLTVKSGDKTVEYDMIVTVEEKDGGLNGSGALFLDGEELEGMNLDISSILNEGLNPGESPKPSEKPDDKPSPKPTDEPSSSELEDKPSSKPTDEPSSSEPDDSSDTSEPDDSSDSSEDPDDSSSEPDDSDMSSEPDDTSSEPDDSSSGNDGDNSNSSDEDSSASSRPDGSSSSKPDGSSSNNGSSSSTPKPTEKPDGSKIDLNAGVGNNLGTIIIIVCLSVTAVVLGVCGFWLYKKHHSENDEDEN